MANEDILCLSSGNWAFINTSTNGIYQTNSKWEINPNCVCSSPVLIEELHMVEKCENKIIGEKCRLECKSQYSMSGEKDIICGKNAKWSKLPLCIRKKCPLPILPDTLQFKEDCSSKQPGQSCNLECKEKYVLRDPNPITCQTDGNWTTLPECHENFCHKPILPESLTFSEDCLSKIVGETCKVKCLNRDETYEISCLNETHWSSFPVCSCSTPSFAQNIELEENCSMKKPGDTCKITCVGASILKKHMYITCMNNNQWSDEPFCKKDTCLKPILPNYLLFDEDCTNKAVGEQCKVMCKMGGRFIHEDSIICLEGKHWSSFPICTCPIPYIQDELETLDNCAFKKPGEKCLVKCKDSTSTLTSFYLCKSDSTWDKSTQPHCKKNKCQNVNFLPTSVYSGNCENKSEGDLCFLSCRRGGTFLNGINYIKCKSNGKWTRPPKCSCPALMPPEEYILEENCSEKSPGEICHIRCKNGADLKNKNYITCDNSTTWVDFPQCRLDFCPPPMLHSKLKISEENCNRKSPGNSCKLSCENGGLLNENDRIYCSPKQSWSSLPNCTCTKPILPLEMEFKENCDGKTVREQCLLSCKSHFSDEEVTDVIVCIMEKHWMWSALQSCTCPYPTHLLPHVRLGNDCANLRHFGVGKKCSVYCENGGKIFNGPQIVCIAKNKWSSSPFCSCTPPPPRPYVNYTNCLDTLPGTRCTVSCSRGIIDKTELYCNKYYEWEKLPECTVIPCQDAIFENELFGYNCSNLVSGDICKVGCMYGAHIVGANFIKCIQHANYMWLGERAICVCTPPLLTEQHTLTASCNFKKKGEHCLIGCRNKAVPDAYSTCVMEINSMWTPFPECELDDSIP